MAGYTLLQLAIEEVSGSAFNDYMRSNVLQPLGGGYPSSIELQSGRTRAVYVGLSVPSDAAPGVYTGTLTTTVGFGSLLTANHFGLNSLGLLSIMGIAAALVTTLFILPAAMQWLDDRRAANA